MSNDGIKRLNNSLSNPCPPHASFGWCSKCNVEHRLEEGNARHHAQLLMQELDERQSIDFQSIPSHADPRCSLDYLWGEARGQMFGVLECEDSMGKTVVLRAFSSQYNALWNVDGWVPPLFDTEAYDQIMNPGDVKIKDLGKRIAALGAGDEGLLLKQQRKHLSQTIMKDLHRLYVLHNFCGETAPLEAFFQGSGGPPTGAGDCCAPKLLNHAAKNNLRPLGIAEFYWGKTNRSGTREHGRFYSCCSLNCQPILGFMLCGIDHD